MRGAVMGDADLVLSRRQAASRRALPAAPAPGTAVSGAIWLLAACSEPCEREADRAQPSELDRSAALPRLPRPTFEPAPTLTRPQAAKTRR
jgi:hypothetical protein